MPAHGLCLRLTHTGKAADSVHITDVQDGIDVLNAFRKAGPIYVPVPAKGGVALVVYSGDVAVSYEKGGIRGFIDGGYLTAEFVAGVEFSALLPSILDEGILLTPTPVSINFVGAGVTATAVGDDVTVTIPGGGVATHPGLAAPGLVWAVSGHTGTLSTLAGFDAGGAAVYYSLLVTGDVTGTFPGPLSVGDFTFPGQVRGDVLYFNGTNWTVIHPGVSGEVFTTQGAGADPLWSSAGSTQLLWGADAVSSSTTTRYLFPSYNDSLAQTIPIQIRVARAGTLRNMRVRQNVPGGNGNAVVYTIRVNGVASAVTVSMASTGIDGSDLVNTVVVAAGDLLDIEITKAVSLGGGSPGDVAVTVEFL